MKEYNCPDCTVNVVSCKGCPRYLYKANTKTYNYIRFVPIQPSDIDYENSACKYCPNNPINGGSGICHCIMGTPITTF
jgi:hypothetical protein